MKRFVTLITVFGAVAAICVPLAAARLSLTSGVDPSGSASSFYTPAALRADGLRWQALADSQPASSFYTPAALDAWAARMQAQAQYELAKVGNVSPDDRTGVHGIGPQPVVTTGDDGVDVRVIGIGLGSGFFALLLVGGFVLMMRRSRRQQLAHV
jgi:hypothetical protein